MKIEAKIKELKESFKEWNDTTEGFPSERLLTAINKVISHKNSLTNPDTCKKYIPEPCDKGHISIDKVNLICHEYETDKCKTCPRNTN